MPQKKKIILGSESVYRRAVLDELAPEITYEVRPANIDEKALGSRNDHPIVLTSLLARAKSNELVRVVDEPCVIITADAVAVFRRVIREKPVDAAEAVGFLSDYARGETVTFVTSVCVTDVTEPGRYLRRTVGTDIAHVQFGPITPHAIACALVTGTVFKTAGAVVIEDPDIAPFVKRVWNASNMESDARTSVMGMPRLLTLDLLRQFGAI